MSDKSLFEYLAVMVMPVMNIIVRLQAMQVMANFGCFFITQIRPIMLKMKMIGSGNSVLEIIFFTVNICAQYFVVVSALVGLDY